MKKLTRDRRLGIAPEDPLKYKFIYLLILPAELILIHPNSYFAFTIGSILALWIIEFSALSRRIAWKEDVYFCSLGHAWLMFIASYLPSLLILSRIGGSGIAQEARLQAFVSIGLMVIGPLAVVASILFVSLSRGNRRS